MTVEEVYDQIKEQEGVLISLLNQARKTPVSPSRLSDVCMKLSVLNALLGGFVAELKKNQLDKEAELYHNPEHKTATAAKDSARIDSKDERYEFTRAETKHNDLWKLISMAQTHIRAVGDEMKGNL